MHTITARNIQQALPMAIACLKSQGRREDSRAGPVLRYPGPVVTVLEQPQERVIFYPWRDANPFFHIVEAAWMLAGRNDLKQLTPYVKRMAEFSDDGGVTQPGAYGKRWRGWATENDVGHGYVWVDQLDWVVKRLRANPGDRRVVIQHWDPWVDTVAAEENGADVPCNISMLPWVMDGKLHLSIFNRSNDIMWGLYGANAVHFSVCLEYLAGRLGLAVGTMTTFSNNFHAYEATLPPSKIPMAYLAREEWRNDPYEKRVAEPFSMAHEWTDDVFPEAKREVYMREDLNTFFEAGAAEALQTARWPWLRRVLVPMALAHQRYKGPRDGRYAGAHAILAGVAATDWRRAAAEWLERREHGST